MGERRNGGRYTVVRGERECADTTGAHHFDDGTELWSWDMSTPDRPIRVIQWTTGNIGKRSLHAIIGRPDMELVGVYAHGADKVGVDAADLAGWPEPTGITATNDIEALIAFTPDACCYNPLWPRSTNCRGCWRPASTSVRARHGSPAASSRPKIWTVSGKPARRAIRRSWQRRTPGNDEHGRHGALGLVRAGRRDPDHRVGRLFYLRIRGNPDRHGLFAGPRHPGLAESVRRESEVFTESAAMMADAIGAKLDRMTFDVAFTPATGDTDLGFMKIPKDTVGGVLGYHRGWVGDNNVVSVGFNWTMGDHVTPPKPLEHGHVIQVFGLPNMRTVLHCLPPKDWTEPGFMGLGMIYTAMPVTNAVPASWPRRRAS